MEENPYPDLTVDLQACYSWQIWALRTTKRKSEIHLLYSWILPSQKPTTGWSVDRSLGSENLTINDKSILKLELTSTEFTGTGIEIQTYLRELEKGKTLIEIDVESEGEVPKSFHQLCLGESPSDISKKYHKRGEVILVPNELLMPWKSQGLPSPSKQSVFLNEYLLLDKLPLIAPHDIINDLQTLKKFNVFIVDILRRETGFDMSRSSAPRLGNIEWYRDPASNSDMYPLIRISHQNKGKKDHKLIISFDPHLSASVEISIRCRILNGKEVIRDELKRGVWKNRLKKISFEAPDGTTGCTVTVWANQRDQTKLIIFEKSLVFMTSMNISPSVVSSEIKSSGMVTLSKIDKREQQKARKLGIFPRSVAIETYQITPNKDRNIPALANSSKQLMGEIFPEISQSEFFLNGWDEEISGSGKFAFIVWILDVISGTKKGGLLLLDPYFDAEAIEIFANTRTSNTKFTILTCMQHRERITTVDECEEVDEPNPYTEAIRNKCLVYHPLLEGIDLNIKEIKNIDGGKKQVFHDRYMILSDEDGKAIKGFHLSNSLQGATRKSPLLVTEIPKDILIRVVKYVNGLLDPQLGIDKKKTEIISIYPNIIQTADHANAESEEETENFLRTIPNVTYLLNYMLASPFSEQDSIDDIYVSIKKQGLVTETDNFCLDALPSENIISLVSVLSDLDQPNFQRMFTALGNLLAHGNDHHYDPSLIYNDYDAFVHLNREIKNNLGIADKIISFILTSSSDSNRNSPRLYNMLTASGFEVAVENGVQQLKGIGPEYFDVSYGVSLGFEILKNNFPLKAISLTEQLFQLVKTNGFNEADLEIRKKLYILSMICHKTFNFNSNSSPKIWNVMKSNHPELRAAAVASLLCWIFSYLRDHLELTRILDQLKVELIDQEIIWH